MPSTLFQDPRGGFQVAPKLLIVDLTADTNVPASATDKFVSGVRVLGAKALSATATPTANTGTVSWGYAAANSGANALRGTLPVFSPTNPATELVINLPAGQTLNLAHLLFRLGTAGDKVIIEYWE